MFGPRPRSEGGLTLPFAASTLLHVATVAAIALLTALGVRETVTEARVAREPARLVFLALPGPGGGGGGGGLKRPEPPARAELKGKSALRSPVRTEPAPTQGRAEAGTAAASGPIPGRSRSRADVPVVQAAPPVPPVVAPVATVRG